MDLEYNAGKWRWIECRAQVLRDLRGMTEGEALEKAKVEFDRFAKLDAKRDRHDGVDSVIQ